MKRPSLRWSATPFAVCLVLALGGCGVLGKKKGADPATAGAEDGAKPGENQTDSKAEGKKKQGAPEGDAGTKPDGSKKERSSDDAKKDGEKNEGPGEAASDPTAAEEFKGLAKGEPEFVLACRALANGGKATMTGKDGMVFETRELAALSTVQQAGTPRHAALVGALKAKAEALRAAGLELVIAPVPTKPVVYPDFLGTDPALKDRRYDSYLQSLYSELEKAGVRVVDTTKALRSDRFDRNAGSFPKAGVIWSPTAAATTARAIHAAARKAESVKSIARDKTIVSRSTALTQNGEAFKVRSVGWAQGESLVPATVPKEGAPIIVVGDAHAAAHRTSGVNASLADELSLAFGAPVDVRSASGSGWREALEFTPAKGSPTRLVVWCFSSAMFLEAPAAPKKPAARPRRAANRGDTGDEAAVPRSTPGAGLQLRDDPGLDARPE